MNKLLASILLLTTLCFPRPVVAQAIDFETWAITYYLCNVELDYARSGLSTLEEIRTLVNITKKALEKFLIEEKGFSKDQAEAATRFLMTRINLSLLKYKNCDGITKDANSGLRSH